MKGNQPMPAKSKVETKPDFVDDVNDVDTSLVTTAPDDWDFETVADESPTKVIFEKFNDTFVGQFVELLHIVPDNGEDPFDLFTFRSRDENLYAVNSSYKMIQAMAEIEPGTWVRLTYVKDIDTRKGNPMKDIKVEKRR
jgi:tRNA nucleotidyltransferase/poly(A) polymerase